MGSCLLQFTTAIRRYDRVPLLLFTSGGSLLAAVHRCSSPLQFTTAINTILGRCWPCTFPFVVQVEVCFAALYPFIKVEVACCSSPLPLGGVTVYPFCCSLKVEACLLHSLPFGSCLLQFTAAINNLGRCDRVPSFLLFTVEVACCTLYPFIRCEVACCSSPPPLGGMTVYPLLLCHL